MSLPRELPSAAQTLDELLAWHDHRFVHCAYLTLMGREPDPQGLQYYLARLRAGHAKLALLNQLRRSAEGRAQATHLPGLEAALGRHRRGRWPLVGWLLRQLEGTEGNGATQRHQRALEQQLAQLREESQARFEVLEAALVDMRNLVANMPVGAMSKGAHGSALPTSFTALSPRMRSVHHELLGTMASQDRAAG